MRAGESPTNQYYPATIDLIIRKLREYVYRILLVGVGAIGRQVHRFCTGI
jgi:hypothetical protein